MTGLGLVLPLLLGSQSAWAVGAECRSRSECHLGAVDVPTVETPIATNHLLPLYWGCTEDWSVIPGFSPSTFFPEVVREDGTVLGALSGEYFRFPFRGSDLRIALWSGPVLPAETTLSVRSRWDGRCTLQTSVCVMPGEPAVDCTLSDSCCNLDASPVLTQLATFRTGPGPDLVAPQTPSFSIVCAAHNSGPSRWTITEIRPGADGGELMPADVFEIRFFGRREDEPPGSAQLVARELRQGLFLSPSVVAVAGPIGNVAGTTAIGAVLGTWLITAEAVDYAGNVGPPSEAVRLLYPDACSEVEHWADPLDAAFAPEPDAASGLGDASAGKTEDAGRTSDAGAVRGGGCGCRLGGVARAPLALLALLAAVVCVCRRPRRPRPRARRGS